MSLHRFHEAQAATYATALAELQAGRKQSHWMWFIFPQLASLGRSGTAKFYGIADLAEARAYFADPVLGPRLIACANAVLSHPHSSAEAILGHAVRHRGTRSGRRHGPGARHLLRRRALPLDDGRAGLTA